MYIRWKRLNYFFSLTMYRNVLTLFPEYLGHTRRRHFFKFIPRTYLQTAGWVIPRLGLCTLQTCFTNLLREISLTFELLWAPWPSHHSLLCSLISLTLRSPFSIHLFHILLCLFLAQRLHLNQTTSKRSYCSARHFTFLYLWGKVNLSMVVWTAPRFTLPSLSSSCRSS